MKNLTSKDIPFLIAIILFIVLRDIWSLVREAWLLSKPHFLKACDRTHKLAVEALANLCQQLGDSILSIYIDVDEESNSFWVCLDAIAYSIVRDVGSLLVWMSEKLLEYYMTVLLSEHERAISR